MKARKQDKQFEAELAAMLADRFPGLTVEIIHSERWTRPCATFRWAGFATLLPEERFHRLATVIPEDYRESRMKGFVWLELAPDETVDAFLKLPRSEDVADREVEVYAGLMEGDFFESLEKAMGASPEKNCPGDFSEAVAILSAKKFSPAKIRDAQLVFIRHGAYCDCQVLLTAQPALAKLPVTAA